MTYNYITLLQRQLDEAYEARRYGMDVDKRIRQLTAALAAARAEIAAR